MPDSILNDTKKVLGLALNYDAFDADVIMHINAVFSTLHDLGVGPIEGFGITDSTAVWEDFLTDPVSLRAVKSYVYLRVRLLFDPPNTSYLLEAFQKQIQELEWRLNTKREATQWTDPNPPVVVDPPL